MKEDIFLQILLSAINYNVFKAKNTDLKFHTSDKPLTYPSFIRRAHLSNEQWCLSETNLVQRSTCYVCRIPRCEKEDTPFVLITCLCVYLEGEEQFLLSTNLSEMGIFGSKQAPPRSNTPPLESQWRDIGGSWTPEFSNALSSEIQSNDTGSKTVKNPGLLLLGPVGAGKSTFVNSVFSISKGRLVNKAYTGASAKSYTTAFTRFNGTGKLSNFRLCDTMGVEDTEGEGFHVSDVVNLIEGHVRNSYQFNPRHPLTSSHSDYNPNPDPEEKTHCVIFVIDSHAVAYGSVSYDMKKKITQLQEEIKRRNIPRVLILTKADLLCEEVSKDISAIFKSTKVKKAVKKASEIFEIPLSNIHPVKNYEGEITLDPLKSIPLLLALRQIVHFASDFVEEN